MALHITRGFLTLLLLGSGVLCRNYKPRSKLQFSPLSRGYTNILVAISPDIDERDCVQVVQELQNTLSETSALLYSATGGTSHFATVNILLPRQRCTSLNNTIAATAADSYATADLKVTENHPLAKTLPWTRQYRGCSLGADDIFLPATNFLLSPNLTLREKGGILLQEWAKFRYGVFSEFSHYDDQLYSPCYRSSGGRDYMYSSCSSTELPPLFQGNGNCRTEVENKKQDMLERLGSATEASSLMFMPHLSSVTKFCTNETHNAHAPNKQNIFCGGQSVTHVRETHPDFTSARASQRQVPNQPTYTIIQHNMNEYKPGLLIVLENTDLIREQDRLRYLKQSLASVISLLPLQSMVGLIFFKANTDPLPTNSMISLDDDSNRATVIQNIIDVETPTVAETSSKLPLPRQAGSNPLGYIIETAFIEISKHGTYDWQVLLITNNRGEGFSTAVTSIAASSASVTVITLDGGDSQWMNLYTSSNVRNVLSFSPNCISQSGVLCSQWSGLMVEGVIEAMWPLNRPQWQKAGDAILTPGQISTVVVDVNNLQFVNYKFFITLFQPYIQNSIRVRAPSGADCNVNREHDYGYLLGVTGCSMQTGNWSVDLSQIPTTSSVSRVTVWIETTSPPLNIYTSLGVDRKVEVVPNGGIPVFARISDSSDAPVTSADVHVELGATAQVIGTQLALKDDGVDPDVTMDDGVYSGVLVSDLSANPSWHIGRVKVATSSDRSKIVSSLGLVDAALLDTRMTEKCCGSRVPIDAAMSLSGSRLTSLLPGFRTKEAFNPGSIPPSRIGSITVVDDDGSKLWLDFIAPGASHNQGRVTYYESCCTHLVDGGNSGTVEVSSCHAVTPATDCSPADPGIMQGCILTRNSLANNHINVSQGAVTLGCQLRGVNALGLAGQKSMGSVVVEVSTADSGVGKNSCSSLSDDCLPIDIFWGLIGCIGGLLLILIAIIICWCIWARRQNKKGDQEEVLLSTNRRRSRLPPLSEAEESPPPPNKDSPLYNVYVNKAYITEGDGGMKLVAADGQLFPLDGGPPPQSSSTHQNNNEPIYNRFNGVSIVPVPPVRRRSVPDDVSLRDDMDIYKSKPHPPPKPGRPNSLGYKTSVPVPRHRPPRPESGYANSNNTNPNNPVNQSNPQVDIDLPVYASVNRNGRSRTPVSLPPSSGFSTFRPSSATPRQAIPSHFGGRSKDDSFIPSSTRFAPKRYDAFPSSDSETYSDMSRSIAPPSQPPPPPPPFPPNRASKPPPYNPPPPPPPPPVKKPTTYDEYDDDSEHWDDEDFDFHPPGVSYA